MIRNLALFLFTLFPLFSSLYAFDGGGHNIRVKLDNYPEKSLVLGFYYGDKQYVKDTVEIDANGYFNFKADTLLPCGIYLLVLMPENSFVQVLVPEIDQDFTLTTDAKDSVAKMKVKGSDDNALFYDYLRYINDQRPLADSLRTLIAGSAAADSARLALELANIDSRVKKYQQDIISKYTGSLTSKIILASIEPEMPEFKGSDEKDLQTKRYFWYKQHYFDNLNLADPCMLHSPVAFTKVDYFINKLTPQHPDSINQSIDYVVDKIKANPETFKFYLIHFLNTYAKSTFVGMDACYVHIANTYYCTGMASWANKEDLEKICDNARRLEPILIGKKAPNITLKQKDDTPVTLWDIDSEYTVLFFWDPECGHCKKSAPFMVDFAKKFQGRGVIILAVCTAVTDKAAECWKSAEEKEFSDLLFLNAYDPYLQSRFKTLYDIRSTPQIFVLNKEKEIVMKRIGAEQMIDVMEQVIKFNQEKQGQGK